MLHRISINDLQPGMYVNQVLHESGDVKVRSKGIVRSSTVIEKLKSKGVSFVEIDTSKGLAPAEQEAVEPTSTEEPQAPTQSKVNAHAQIDANGLQAADAVFQKAILIQQRFLKQLEKGQKPEISKLTALTQDILECVFENPAAMLCLSMIQKGNDGLLEHSLNCSIYMAILADASGYDYETVESASLAGLLMDTGLSQLPNEMLVPYSQIAPSDRVLYESHIDISLELLEGNEDLPPLVKQIIEQHHERIDGNGFPNALKDDAILPLAKLAGIIDEFSVLGMTRPFGFAYSHSKVLKQLSQNQGLDKSLVNRLISLFGIYPIGSVVKLKSGKLGIVSKANPNNMLEPKVMTFYSVNSEHFQEVKRVDISKSNEEIESSVGPEDFAIDLPRFFSEVFIHQIK